MPAMRSMEKMARASQKSGKVKRKSGWTAIGNVNKLPKQTSGEQKNYQADQDDPEIILKSTNNGKSRSQGTVAFNEMPAEGNASKKSKLRESKGASLKKAVATKFAKSHELPKGSTSTRGRATLDKQTRTTAKFNEGQQEMKMAVDAQDEELFDTEGS